MAQTLPLETSASAAGGLDLLRVPGVRALILWKGFPYLFQGAPLAALLALAAVGRGFHTPVGVPAKLYAESNLATLLVWGLWWPFVV